MIRESILVLFRPLPVFMRAPFLIPPRIITTRNNFPFARFHVLTYAYVVEDVRVDLPFLSHRRLRDALVLPLDVSRDTRRRFWRHRVCDTIDVHFSLTSLIKFVFLIT